MLFRNGKSRTAERTTSLITAARPHVRRAMSDKDIQDALRRSYEAGRRVYEELWGQEPKKAAKRALNDDKLHANLTEALGGLREAAGRMAEKERRRRTGRGLLALLAGGAVAAALVPPLMRRLRGSGDNAS
jgi:hypothetical protein